MDRFRAAPWAKLLWFATVFSTALLLGVGYAAWRVIPRGTSKPGAELVGTLVAWTPPAIAALAILFVVRGFEIRGQDLLIDRLLWSSVVRLEGLQRIAMNPDILKGSLRVFGNGGLFSITGTFWNRRLGRYRAFITDPKKTVVLVTSQKVFAVSPEDPRLFVERLRAIFPSAIVEPTGKLN